MYVIHFAEVLHAGRNASQHADQLEDLKLAVVGLKCLGNSFKGEHDVFSARLCDMKHAILAIKNHRQR